MNTFLALDLFPLAAAVLAAVSCALLGNFLVLRKQALMGDAISHAVLPGLVIAFLVSASRDPLTMFIGAAAAGVATVVLIELVRTLGRVEPGAAMGVVFSVLFALGVLLIEQAAARHVDLDADCVLYGQLQTLVWWDAPPQAGDLFAWSMLAEVPRQVWTLLGSTAAAALFIALFFKELRVAAFDPQLATAQGIRADVMHYALMLLVAVATVAAFEAVGSILVIAMLVCPAATARLTTDRLVTQVLASIAFALIAAVGGYFGASHVPAWFGLPDVNPAGSMTVVAGFLVGAAALLSPSHGLVARAYRRAKLGREALVDDLLAGLLRLREAGRTPALPADAAPQRRHADHTRAARLAAAAGFVHHAAGPLALTDAGLRRAAAVLRRHRLWESFLVHDAGLRADHVHDTAETLEHLGLTPTDEQPIDPHGRPIYPPNPPAP